MATDGIVIERSKHAQQFVIIGNAEARDARVSLRAHGLHLYLLSLPPGWRVTTTDIAREFPEGRDAVRTALNELINARYVTKKKHQDARGHWHTAMTVHDKAQPETDSQASVTEDGFPGVGNPGVGESGAKELKTVTEDVEDQKMVQARVSRRGAASSVAAKRTTPEVISQMREAIAETCGQEDADALTDGEVLGLYFKYCNPKQKRVRDLVAYFSGILADGTYVETLLANSEPVCVPCWHYESDCQCPAESAA